MNTKRRPQHSKGVLQMKNNSLRRFEYNPTSYIRLQDSTEKL